MANELSTTFKFNDADGAKVDALYNKLLKTNQLANNLANQPISFGNSATKVKSEIDSLGSSMDKLSKNLLKEDLGAGFKKLQSDIQKTATSSLKSFEKSEKEKADFAKAAYADIARYKQTSIQREIELEKQLSKQLAAEQTLRVNDAKRANLAAIREAKNEEMAKRDVLAKTSQFSNSSQDAVDKFNRRTPGTSGNQSLNLSSFQKQNLSYQINDVLTGIASGQPLTQIAAQQSGQIAQIFSPAQASALVAAYAPLVGILAAGAAAIALTYKITGDIRAEAERRLKVEEKINSTINKQILSKQKLLNDFNQSENFNQQDRVFNRSLEGETLTGLTERRERLQKLASLVPSETVVEDGKLVTKDSESLKVYLGQISSINKEIDQLQNKKDNYKKGTIFEDILRIEEQVAEFRAKRQEEFKKSVEEGKKKVEELGKTINSTFSDLYSKTGANNPIYTALNEGNQALEKLKENIKSLPEEMQKSAIGMQLALNSNANFSANLQNKFAGIDLREQADNFRNPTKPIDKNQINDVVNRYINGSNSTADLYRRNFGQTTAYNAGGVDKLNESQIRSIYEVALLSNVSGVTRDSLVSKLASQRLGTDENLSLHQRLQKRIDAVRSSNPLNGEQKDIADRQLLSFASSIDPSKLNDEQRNTIADAFDRRAAKTENYQKDANALLQKQLDTQIETNKIQKRYLELAEKEGIKAVLEIIDKTNGSVNVREGTAPTKKDTEKQYQE